MPPRTRKPKAADMAFLADILKEYGNKEGNVDEVIDSVKPLEEVENDLAINRLKAMSEIEGLLRQQHYRHSFTFKKCKKCSAVYQTNYCYQDYCSEVCRDVALQEHFGMTSAQLRALRDRAPASYWEYETPMMIRPETVESLKIFCELFLEGYENIKTRAGTMESLQGDQEEESEASPFQLPSEDQDVEQWAPTVPEVPYTQPPANDEPQQSDSLFALDLPESDDDLYF